MTLYCSLCQDFVYDPDFDTKLVGLSPPYDRHIVLWL